MDHKEVSKVVAALNEAGAEVRGVVSKLEKREAARQQAQFEFKPWKAGVPTKDVIGNNLCFLDEGKPTSARYWVPVSRDNGAHVRTDGTARFIAVAQTEAEAVEIGGEYAKARKMEAARIAYRTERGGMLALVFDGQRRILD